MNYLKKQIDAQDEAATLQNLSQMQDMRTAPEDTPAHQMRGLPVPQCDWCADDVPLYVFAATHMSNGEACLCWRWMACSKCNRLIENGNWDALERRVAARFKKLLGAKLQARFGNVPDHLVREAVHQSLKQFHQYAIRVQEPKL